MSMGLSGLYGSSHEQYTGTWSGSNSFFPGCRVGEGEGGSEGDQRGKGRGGRSSMHSSVKDGRIKCMCLL